ncbi:MAG: TlpA family protein disulfide reductase [Deltaproteobacteria bacterium]|nr:TlpA family protein disulfide reductase [Deltaproteobacteria bacterium]
MSLFSTLRYRLTRGHTALQTLVLLGAALLMLTAFGVFLVFKLTHEGSHDEDEQFFRQMRVKKANFPYEAIDFSGTPINKSKPNLYDYRGKFIVLNFWATWCEPCKAEMPELQQLATAMEGENVVVLGISGDDKPDKVVKYLKENGLTFPVLLDEQLLVSKLYRVDGIPRTILIGPDMMMLGSALGPRRWNDPLVKRYIRSQLAKAR